MITQARLDDIALGPGDCFKVILGGIPLRLQRVGLVIITNFNLQLASLDINSL